MTNQHKYLIAYQTMVIRGIVNLTRTWQVTILAPVISMTLYFIIFGNLIGPRIGLMQDFTYIEYIAPGLIMMAIINNAYANTSINLFLARLQKDIEAIIIAPMPNYLILLGFITSGIIRGLLVGIGVTVVALFFTKLHVHSMFIMLSTVILASLLFSLAGLMNGIFARTFDDINIIPTFVLTPLTYLGGVFYSINLLPEFWRQASSLNPILYIVNTFRYGILGITDVNLFIAFAILLASIMILFAGNLYLLNKGVGIRT